MFSNNNKNNICISNLTKKTKTLFNSLIHCPIIYRYFPQKLIFNLREMHVQPNRRKTETKF